MIDNSNVIVHGFSYAICESVTIAESEVEVSENAFFMPPEHPSEIS
jgi:hypothetical protein